MNYISFFIQKIKPFFRIIYSLLKAPLLFFLLIALCFWSDGYTLEDFGIEATLNPNDYCHITDVNYTAVVQDTNVSITEYLTFDVHASSKSNPFKELWRELPEDIVDGVKVTYRVDSVSQVLENGEEIPYKETSKMYWEDSDYTRDATQYWHHSAGSGRHPDDDESLLIYIPWTYRDTLTFKIQYTMYNASLRYNDCAELYLSLFSGKSVKWLKSYQAKILVPNELMPTDYYAYSFGTKYSRIPFTESDTLVPGHHAFSIQLDQKDLKFNHHNRYIEFCLLAYGKDKHIFAQSAPRNQYTFYNVLDECIAENEAYSNQVSRFRMYRLLCLAICICLSLCIISRTKKRYQEALNNPQIAKPDNEPEYFRDIPSDLDPYFASELVFLKDPFNKNKEKQEEYAAILLSLVRKKYVTITKLNTLSDWKDTNTLIHLEPIHCGEENTSSNLVTYHSTTGEILEPLTTSERLYYDLLSRQISSRMSQSISLYSLQQEIDEDYVYTNNFIKNIEKKPALECGFMQGYFSQMDYDAEQKKFEKSGNLSFVLAIILLVFVNGFSYFTPMMLSLGAYTLLGITLLWRSAFLSMKAPDLVFFTPFGANEQAKWRGLYNFLNSNTLMNEREVHEIALWEKYLIYATAFGISEKVISAIKLHVNTLDIDTSPILHHQSYIHSSHFHSTSRGFGRSLHTSSRGGFSGHGYGGGGRGGGGGGGGH